jgi:hypothetical protein
LPATVVNVPVSQNQLGWAAVSSPNEVEMININTGEVYG